MLSPQSNTSRDKARTCAEQAKREAETRSAIAVLRPAVLEKSAGVHRRLS